MSKQLQPKETKIIGNWIGLTPLVVFLLAYLATSIILNDFYKMPITVAFLIASVYAILITPKLNLNDKVEIYSRGASDTNILTMIWIFVLSGAFAHSAKEMGAIDASVHAILNILPPSFILPGVFIVACFISTAIGTSVGTVVALAPIAIGLGEGLGINTSYMAGLIVGGAFFGDNLSFISDTTIAATRTQGCQMRDKFKANFRLVFPAALIVLIFYTIEGWELTINLPHSNTSPWLILPYLLIITLSLFGVNVMLALLIGLLSGGFIGIILGRTDFWSWIGSLGAGINTMGELIIVTLLAGGLLGLIRHNGGFEYLLTHLTKHIKGKRGAEATISLLVFLSCLCTANNTIAILTTGTMAKDLANKYGISPQRSASLLDTFSCFAQGIIPYGAQLLLMAGMAKLSPIEIIPYLYYPYLMGFIACLSIIFVRRTQNTHS